MGRQLAIEAPVDADIVVPVPDSGVTAAMGFAHESGIPLQFGLIRNHYVGRTFIEPEQRVRDFGVKLKLNPVRNVLAGKRVVLIDDSIVRGTTSRRSCAWCATQAPKRCTCASPARRRFRPATTAWTRLRKNSSSPPTSRWKRFANTSSADSLAYLSLEGLRKAVGDGDPHTYCTACYTGKYPTKIVDVEDIAPAMVSTT